tara:strand:- start:3482 stop:4621 length:1140 start_codon:yes stop_codon:yes gene_type:complete
MKGIVFLLFLIILSGCQTITNEPQEFSEDQDGFREEFNKKNCEGGRINFDFPPVNLEKTELLVPLGLMSGNHVTPVDHQYFQNFNNDKADIEVYSPAKGVITNMQHMPNAPPGEDYRIVIDHTCTIQSIYIHIDILSEKLQKKIEEKDYISERIKVEAGEILGYYKTNVDYNIVDQDVTLTGLLIPEHYYGEPWKIHVPETIEYFNEPIKSKLIDLSVRTHTPISGRLDYDIDGKLIGNWFREGTKDYSGESSQDYWIGHLSISPDYLDPNHIIISIGDYNGEQKQFAVKNNSPNPAEVDVSSGLIKYVLVDYDFYDVNGERWDRRTLTKIKEAKNYDHSRGVAFVQMLEDRKLMFEVFPDKQLGEVTTFTDNAKIYER